MLPTVQQLVEMRVFLTEYEDAIESGKPFHVENYIEIDDHWLTMCGNAKVFCIGDQYRIVYDPRPWWVNRDDLHDTREEAKHVLQLELPGAVILPVEIVRVIEEEPK